MTWTLGECRDCGRRRQVRSPGPRCRGCQKTRRDAASEKRWSAHIQKTYGITPDQYFRILDFQGGRCAICQRATGNTRRLSVDHNHALGSGIQSVRGCLCRPCNDVLGKARDDVEYFERAIAYLKNPPARKVLE